MLVQQEEEHFEVEDEKNCTNEKFKLDFKKECFNKCRLELMFDNEKAFSQSMFDGLMCLA